MAKRSVKKKKKFQYRKLKQQPSVNQQSVDQQPSVDQLNLPLNPLEQQMYKALSNLQPKYEYIFRIYKCPYDYNEELEEPPCHICDEHLDPDPDCAEYKNIAVRKKVDDINEMIKVAKVFNSCIKYEPILVTEGRIPKEELGKY